MKIECVLEKLKKFISVVDRITGKNLTLSVLSSILLIASGKTLKLRATNLDIGIEVEIPVKIIKEGAIAVKGSTLNELLSNLTSDKIIILEEINNNLSITTDQTKSTLKCQPINDFPTIPLITSGTSIIINTQKILSGIRSVAYSASLSDIKPELASVYIYHNDDSLVFVATDSFRLAEKKIKFKVNDDFPPIIVPYKNIIEIMRVLELSNEDVKLSISRNQISLSFNNVYLTSRLIDSTFPDYKQIIPKETNTEAIVLKQDLITSLKINNIFTDKFNQVTMDISPKHKKFTISSQCGEVGETNTNLNAALKGDDLVVHINHRYLFDVFQSITSDSISMSFMGNTKPLVIRGISDQMFMYLVMPLNR